MGGKKDESKRPSQLQKGYHLASISYPLVNEGGKQPQMLNAALRAVQFLRYKAQVRNRLTIKLKSFMNEVLFDESFEVKDFEVTCGYCESLGVQEFRG